MSHSSDDITDMHEDSSSSDVEEFYESDGVKNTHSPTSAPTSEITSSMYKIGIKKCGAGGIVTTLDETDYIKGDEAMDLKKFYHVTFSAISAKLTCSVKDESGSELAKITVADGAMKHARGKTMIGTLGKHNHFFDDFYVCDLAPTR